MNLLRTITVAIRALGLNAARSFLTVLGVIIGVGAVIAMVSVGEGAKAKVADSFRAMGTSTLIVTAGSSQSGGVRGGAGSRTTITWDDLAAIAQLPEVAYAAPQLRSSGQLVSEESNWQAPVYGTTSDWFAVREWKVERGEPITAADVTARKTSAVIGKTVADNLFPSGVDPIGQIIRINRTPFVVTGILEKKGISAMGSDNDDQVLIPSSTFSAKISGGLAKFINGQILVSAVAKDRTGEAKAAIEELLRRQHKLREGDDNDFNVRDMAEIVKAQTESSDTISALLFGVALTSLIVGGIGIMNIMLVSVTERTREIGLRMAIGAKGKNILMQFLIEAVLLSVSGGLLGIAAGFGAAKYMAGKFAIPFVVRPDIVLLAVVVSAGVGVIFGLFPAWKASRLDPITALRYE
jgi:putative ABC transport system permease protein